MVTVTSALGSTENDFSTVLVSASGSVGLREREESAYLEPD